MPARADGEPCRGRVQGALWLITATGQPFLIQISHPGLRARLLSANGSSAAARALAERGATLLAFPGCLGRLTFGALKRIFEVSKEPWKLLRACGAVLGTHHRRSSRQCVNDKEYLKAIFSLLLALKFKKLLFYFIFIYICIIHILLFIYIFSYIYYFLFINKDSVLSYFSRDVAQNKRSASREHPYTCEPSPHILPNYPLMLPPQCVRVRLVDQDAVFARICVTCAFLVRPSTYAHVIVRMFVMNDHKVIMT